MQNSSTQIIDTRPVYNYNGWALDKGQIGGHASGARSLPAKWLDYIDWPEIIQAKGFSPEQELILYGETEDVNKTAEQFRQMGFSKITAQPDYLKNWLQESGNLPEKLPRYRNLVPARWLKNLLTGQAVSEYDNDKLVLAHAHYRNRSAYDEGHIPGAIELDTNLFESPETWNRRSPEELAKAFAQAGITADTTVVLYGRFAYPDNNDPFPGSSAGQLAAMRLAFIMLYAGVSDVRILNGGLQAWQDEGFPITTTPQDKQPAKDFGRAIPAHPELAVDIPEAKQILQDPDKNLVSVRSWAEFIGEVSGYNYIKKKGRIPGAVFGNCGSDAYHMENYRNLDHTTREYQEIAALWAEVGITPDKLNAFYCGTGWRGSEAFFNAWLMGWPRVAVFDGGWFEWSNDPNNPYETGTPDQG
jgi:thiosulfate/3-mercaptopyruvate sulfurtransferase